MIAVVAAAATAGFLGSLQCAAMCGPLAAGACRTGGGVARYALGRLVAYAFVGAVLGGLGHAVMHGVWAGRLQSGLLWVIVLAAGARGVQLLLSPSRSAADTADPANALVTLGAPRRRYASRWLAMLADLVPRQPLALGIATGFFPCGLLMAGWMLAASAGHPIAGAATMAAFAVATMPALLAPVVLRRFGAQRLGRWLASARLQGVAWCGLALWLGLRPWLMAHHGGH